jgi:drug/metabolite transporter (DMT)-like permease
MGYLFAFLSATCFGIGNCLWVTPRRQMPFLSVICLRSAMSSAFFGLIICFLHKSGADAPGHVSAFRYVQAIVISLVSSVGLLLYVFSLRFTAVSIAVPVSSVSAFFGIATATLFLHEAFTSKILIVFFVLTLGLLFLEDRGLRKRYVFSYGVWLNLGAAAFWGVTFALFYIPVTQLGALRFSFVLESTVFGMSLTTTLLGSQWKTVRLFVVLAQFKWIALLAMLGVGGVLFYNLSLQFIPVVVVSLTGCLVPGISVLVSTVWLREPITGTRLMGILLLTVGVATLFYHF